MRRMRLAYVVSHPIQYQAELLRRIARDPAIDLTVFFCSDFSARSYVDKGFGVAVQWDIPLLEGYRYRVLPRWRDADTPGVFRPISRGFFRAFRQGSEEGPFDVLWVHGYSTVNSLHAMLAAKALGIPVLVRAESSLRDRPRGRLKLLAKRLFFATLRHMVDGVLTIGAWNRAYWEYYLGNSRPFFQLPYAVDNAYFAERTRAASDRRQELQRELDLSPERPVILFASKLQNRKHADHLLEAYLRMRPSAGSDPEPYLVIVGDGEQRPALEQRVKEANCTSVRFAGFRNQSELPRFFDLSDVFVLPSRHEPWGLIVNEAMAAGLPVIVSDDVGCHPDLVENGVNGFVFPVGDVAALTVALQRVLEHGAAEQMGERGQQRIQSWSYEEDVRSLKHAVASVSGLSSQSSPAIISPTADRTF